MAKKMGLGRKLSDLGLSELLSDISSLQTMDAAAETAVRQMAIDELSPGKYQPRLKINQDSITELATSIRSQGIIQPLLARPINGGGYEIIAGERRWRAAQSIGLEQVPVIVKQISDNEAIAHSLIENIQREDLNPIDTALALERLISEFAITHEAAADIVGKSRVTITNLLRLLSLHPDVKNMVQDSELEMGHARALLSLKPQQQVSFAKKILHKKLSVRATEKLVRLHNDGIGANVVQRIQADPNIINIQRQLADKLGANVVIEHAKNGKGKLTIAYHNMEQLDGVLQIILGALS